MTFIVSYPELVSEEPDLTKDLRAAVEPLFHWKDGNDRSEEIDAGKALRMCINLILAKVLRPVRGRQTPPPWGGKFLDFGGIILNDSQPQEVHATREKLVSQVDPTNIYTSLSALERLQALWPMIRSMRPAHERSQATPEFRKPEYSASRFQGSRALYISSLGATSPSGLSTAPDDPAFAVRYMIIVKYRSKRMLARLIDRLHRAGTMRVAAVRDLEGVDKANKQLDKISISPESWDQTSLPRQEATVNDFHDKLVGIRTSPDIEGGLEFRAYRAKYYLEQFQSHVRALRVSRVPGFQPYDEFVSRRMHSNFETISMTFSRYTELRKELDVYYQRLQAQKSLKNQKDIETHQAEVVILSRRAEIFLLATLIYYSGTIFGKLIKMLFAKSPGLNSEVYGYLCGGVAVLAVWSLTKRASRKK